MQNLRNRVQLIGRLGQDPIAKTLSDGKTLATFSLATSRSYRSREGKKINDTQWHTIVAWGRIAEVVAEYLRKGKEVAVEGTLVKRKYTTQDGKNRQVTEVTLKRLLMVGTVS